MQILDYRGSKRLVVALAQSAVLISQERLTTIAAWTFIAGPVPNGDGESEIVVHTGHRNDPSASTMRFGFMSSVDAPTVSDFAVPDRRHLFGLGGG